MFNAIAQPFAWLLMTLYNFLNNYALALIVISIIVKGILLPFQMKAKRGQLRQARLQPKLSEIQKKHAANKQKLNEETAKLYKEEGINPASGCLWSFIQMPIMIAMFFAIRQPLTLMMGVGRELLEEGGAIYNKLAEMNFVSTMSEYYIEIAQAQFITEHFNIFAPLSEHLQRISFNLGILNLGEQPHWDFFWRPETDWSNYLIWLPGLILFFFPFISGGAQFISAHFMRKMSTVGTPEAMAGTAGTVLKFMPLMSVWFGFIFPAALSLYWTIGTVLQFGQDVWLTKKYNKILDEEDAEKEIIRKAKEAELEAKRIETERKKAEGLAEQNSNTSKRKKKKGNKQNKLEKAAEWEKQNTPVVEKVDDGDEPSRVGKRRYARGRAYDPDRFTKGGGDSSDSEDRDTEDALDLTDEDIEVDGVAVEKEDYSEDSSDMTQDLEDDADFDESDDDEDEIDDEDVDDADGEDEDEEESDDSADDEPDDVDDGDDSDEADDSENDDDSEDEEDDVDPEDESDSDDGDDSDDADDSDDTSGAMNTEKFDTKRFD